MQASNIYLLTQAKVRGSYIADVALQLLPSELPLSTHLPTLEGWTAELAAGLWLAGSAKGFDPTRVYPARFETLRLIHLVTPPRHAVLTHCGKVIFVTLKL